MGLFSKTSNDDEKDWTTECRNCGGTAVNSNFCSEACSLEHWLKHKGTIPVPVGRTTPIPTVLLVEVQGPASSAKMTIRRSSQRIAA